MQPTPKRLFIEELEQRKSTTALIAHVGVTTLAVGEEGRAPAPPAPGGGGVTTMALGEEGRAPSPPPPGGASPTRKIMRSTFCPWRHFIL